MTTINISLPEQLKNDADLLVREGFYVSFSDLVRDSLRSILANARYEKIYRQAKKDYKDGKAIVLKNKSDINSLFAKL